MGAGDRDVDPPARAVEVTNRDELRRELGRRLEAFGLVPFPPDEADDDRLGELHAELAEYDGYVVGLASSVAGFADVAPRRLEPRPELRTALESSLRKAEEPDRTTAQTYLDYLDELDAIRALAQELAGGRGGS